MNRSRRRNMARALRRGNPVAVKLWREALILDALGLLDDAGEIHCGDCGAIVARPEGWRFEVRCSCGWELREDEHAAA